MNATGLSAGSANLEVATGQVIAPSIGSTRTSADFLAHIQQTVATDPMAEWIFITDQLNTHQSESLVQWVALVCGLEADAGYQRRVRYTQVHGDTSRILTRFDPSDSVCLHPQAYFLVKSGGVVVQYLGASFAMIAAVLPLLKT